MSDLISGDEKELIYGIRYGFRGTKQSVSKYKEIVQEQPSESTWTVWRRFLKKHVCDDQFKIATIKLGHWRTEANKSDRLWPFYYSNSTDCIYRSWRRKWYCHKEYQYDILEKTETDDEWGNGVSSQA